MQGLPHLTIDAFAVRLELGNAGAHDVRLLAVLEHLAPGADAVLAFNHQA